MPPRSKLLMAGMTCLLLALIWPRFLHLNLPITTDTRDFLQGLLIGLSIAMNLAYVARNTGVRDCAE